MRTFLFALVLCSCLATVACGDDDRRAGTPSPDGEGFCCAPEPPSCSCSALGGFATDPRACATSGPCDMPPGDHHLATDAHGCTYYTTPIVPTICACLCFRADLGAPSPDAGTADDAGAADDAGVDDAGVDDAGAADDGGVDGAAP